MSQTFKTNPRVKRAFLARLQGLTAEQVKKQLELDDRVFADQTKSNDFYRWYGEAGLNVRPNVLYYGLHAEARGALEEAATWLEIYINNGGDQKPLRHFLVRHGLIERASAFSLTPTEQRRVIRNRLKLIIKRLDDFTTRDVQADLTACIKLGGAQSLELLFLTCLGQGRDEMAKFVANLMGRKFTRRDYFALGRGLIRYYSKDRETWDYLIAHKLRRLMPLAIQARLDAVSGDFVEDALEMSRLFKVELSLRQLELVFYNVDDGFHMNWALELADQLAKRSAKWRQRMPKIIEKLRKTAMEDLELVQVTKYSRRINRPLETHEIVAMIASAHEGADLHSYMQKAERELYRLLYARTCKLLKLKPVADKPAG